MTYDLLIVGSGPAGTVAAITAAELGLSTAVVAPCPRYKHEGASQSVHPGLLALATRYKIHACFERAFRGEYRAIEADERVQYLDHNEHLWTGWHVDRSMLNSLLHKTLNDFEGVQLYSSRVISVTRNESWITLETADRTSVSGKYLIDATGDNRKIARALCLGKSFDARPMTVWTGLANMKWFPSPNRSNPSFKRHKNGWLWLAPETNDSFTWTHLRADGHRSFEEPFANAIKSTGLAGYDATWKLYRPLCADRVIACGDAAGRLDPAAGQGILTAMVSGNSAAHCVNESLKDPSKSALQFAQYHRNFTDQFQSKMDQLLVYYESIGISSPMNSSKNWK